MKVDLENGDEGTIGEDRNLMPKPIEDTIFKATMYENWNSQSRRILMTDEQLEFWQNEFGE